MIEIFIGLLLLMSGTDNRDEHKTIVSRSDLKVSSQVIVRANNDFSFKIFNILSKDKENDVMSSLSMLSALSILMNGANGETQEDLKKFLEFQTSNQVFDKQTINQGFEQMLRKYQDPIETKNQNEEGFAFNLDNFKHKLNIVNRVINSEKINLKQDFSKAVSQYFLSDIQTADFINKSPEETIKINDWVRNKTNNKIQKLFDDIGKDTTILILNVLYFNGQWEEKFYEGSNQELDFYNNGLTAIKTTFMKQTELFNYGDSDELNSQIIELDYIGNQISFVVILPKERNGLNKLKEKLNSENFENAVKSMTRKNVETFIPKFKIEKSYELMDEINPKPIALTDRADLSGLTTDPMKVSKILHKVFIEVNEKGTEAAAVTAIKIIPMSAHFYPQTFLFKADHPFLFFIRDKTNGIILFSGQINKL